MSRKGSPGNNKARYHNPPNILRQKVGFGGIDDLRLVRAEEFIQSNEFDFVPYAQDVLQKLRVAIKTASAADMAGKPYINILATHIMVLKANGSMFGFFLVSEIASIVLNFLENIEELNADSFHILEVHQRTIEVIVNNNLRGHGGAEGAALAQELQDACARYRKKHIVEIDF